MIESGTLLQNRYRVIKQIGQGGMGAVYVATDERFSSTVAVKQTFFDDPNLRRAFEREAHLLNHLRHTALPRVSDHFTEDGGQFLVMEFIEGSDISELLQQRASALPLADVLRWADELLDALDYLHTHEPSIVHRDIKPQNLKLTPRGQIVLLDFGLAKGTSTATRAQNLTASVFGYSRNYAPLEQIQGTGTDARSDLYSLAATLYHLLTGKPPVDALTRASAIVNGQPDPLRPAHLVHAQVPAAVGEILRRALSQNAAHRQPNAAELRAALRRASNAFANAARPVSSLLAQAPSALDVPTVLEAAPAGNGQQSLSEMRSTTHLQQAAKTSASETTLVEAQGARRRQPVTSYVPTEPELSEPKSTAKLLGVAAAVIVACVLVAFPLMRRTPSPEANSPAQTEASPASAQTDAPDNATQPEAARDSLNNSSSSEATPSNDRPLQARPASESNAARSTNGDAAEPTGNAETNADAANGSSLPAASEKPGLVIQSPAPGTEPVRNTAAEEYDAQRAEELRRRKQQQQEELQRQRQREQQQLHAPPPHYGPPPPPMGGGRRPPPPRP